MIYDLTKLFDSNIFLKIRAILCWCLRSRFRNRLNSQSGCDIYKISAVINCIEICNLYSHFFYLIFSMHFFRALGCLFKQGNPKVLSFENNERDNLFHLVEFLYLRLCNRAYFPSLVLVLCFKN